MWTGKSHATFQDRNVRFGHELWIYLYFPPLGRRLDTIRQICCGFKYEMFCNASYELQARVIKILKLSQFGKFNLLIIKNYNKSMPLNYLVLNSGC